MKFSFFLIFILVPVLSFSQLTGYWQSDVGGCYHILQNGNEVWWASQASENQLPYNVFHGAVVGNNLTGVWNDLPSNPNQARDESISIRIENNTRLVKVASSATYNGSVWTKQSGSCTSSGSTSLWTYAGSRGSVEFSQAANQVTMHLSIKPRTAPSPHYIINATRNGNSLVGTWRFTVKNDPQFSGSNCQGGKFYAQFSPDKNTITVLRSTEDPCNHDWTGTIFYRVRD